MGISPFRAVSLADYPDADTGKLELLTGLQPSVSLCMYRVLQEALHNIITHSEAQNVEVELTSNDREILLRVVDDGVGFDLTHEAEGIGLKSICQRVQSEGGSIDIVSSPNRGTRIEVRTPLKTEDIAGAA